MCAAFSACQSGTTTLLGLQMNYNGTSTQGRSSEDILEGGLMYLDGIFR